MANSATVEGTRVGVGGLRAPKRETATPPVVSGRRLGWRTVAIGIGATVAVASVAGWILWPRGSNVEAVTDRVDLAGSCAKKDAAACLALGELAWAAPDGARDLAAAEHGFQASCDAGEPRGCLRLAHLYEDALAFDAKKGQAPELRRRAAAVYEKACEAQDAYACLVVASLVTTGRGVQKSTPRATQLYAQARPPMEAQCGASDATPPATKRRACGALSLMLARGLGGAKDTAKSLEVLEQTCALGDTSACMLAGSTYADGPGAREMPGDPPRAPAPYKKGCELGEPRACHALAKLLHAGSGAAANAPEALVLETKACDGGVASACMEVGQMTFSGEGGIADPKKAREWFVKEVTLRQKQCDAGLGDECLELSGNYRSRGQGVPIDPQRAKDLEDRAMQMWQAGCDAGVWSECLALRTRLEKEPMPDLKRVRALRERECSLGYEHSCRRLGIAYAPPRP